MSRAGSDLRTGAVEAPLKTPTERLQDFAAAVRRRWLPALLVLTVTVVATGVLTMAQHKTYEATAQILLQPPDTVQSTINPGSVASEQNTERDVTTYAQEITVEPVAEAVRRQLGLTISSAELVSRITVSGQVTSNLVSIAAKDPSPAHAAQLATAFATQYQNYRRQSAVQQIDQTLLAAEADPRSKVPGSAVAQRVQQLQAAAASETGGVEIIRPATIPRSPISASLRSRLMLGVIVGLILALVTVLGLEAADRRLTEAPQFEAAFGAPVLAVIPGRRRWTNAVRLRAARRRAYTDLAARLAFTSVGDGSRVIMVSPASRRERGREAALALTQALGMVGRRVVLIDADLGSPHISGLDERDEPSGLMSVLTGQSSFERELADLHFVAGSAANRREDPWSLVSYWTLPSGPRVAEPQALLARGAMREVLERAKARGDFVLVQTAPLAEPSGVLPLARMCDGIIVLVRQRSMRAERARGIAELLGATKVPLLGTIVVPADSPGRSATGPAPDTVEAREHDQPLGTNGNGGYTHAAPAPRDF